jgi:thiamine biosynthesis lipoprotein
MQNPLKKKKNRNLIIAIIAGNLLLIAAYLLYSARASRPYEADSGFRPVMSTLARVVVVADDKKTGDLCIDEAFRKFSEIENRMSYYKADSEISKINRDAFKEAITVSADTFYLIKRSIQFSELTKGAFDITVGPLKDLWQKAEDTNSVPTEQQLEQVRAKVGYEKIILNEADLSVRFSVDGMKLDLGGIAKGFAVDQAIEQMIQSGARGALVDIGGNIRCFGMPAKGKEQWLIGLQNPDLKAANQIVLTLKLNNKSIATSGDYQRFVLVGGKKYSHIINLKTGQGAEGLSSVTIITEQATDADALSTAVTVLGAEKGLELIEKIPSTETVLITAAPEYKILKTTGADEFIK